MKIGIGGIAAIEILKKDISVPPYLGKSEALKPHSPKSPTALRDPAAPTACFWCQTPKSDPAVFHSGLLLSASLTTVRSANACSQVRWRKKILNRDSAQSDEHNLRFSTV